MPKKLSEIRLGQELFDPVVALQGTCTAKCEYLSGDDAVYLETKDSTGRPIGHWVNVERVTDA